MTPPGCCGDGREPGTAARGGSRTKMSRVEVRDSTNLITAYAGRNFTTHEVILVHN